MGKISAVRYDEPPVFEGVRAKRNHIFKLRESIRVFLVSGKVKQNIFGGKEKYKKMKRS